jgi:parvulin-like peptidyl-prolyl isomerase
VQSSTASEIKANYGEELSVVVGEGVIGSWRGPVPSVYGVHFVRVLEKGPSSVPALTLIEAEVRANLLFEVRQELSRERMEALREAYVVHVERVP